jgi:amino acid adenylation domain-containing protein
VTLGAEPDAAAMAMAQRHDLVSVTCSPTPEPAEVDVGAAPDTPLYIMSTSGTTGTPKRIAIPRSHVVEYLKSIRRLFDFTRDDRFSHFFKLSFDLSVHDLLVTWSTGACLYVPALTDILDPVAYARRHALTVWFSVPSLVGLAIMSRKLAANALPDIRHAIFCGEALSWAAADAFLAAAPNARLTNLYGPTEATIAITHYAIDRKSALKPEASASVPIGRPFPGQEAIVVGPDLAVLPSGMRGELLLGGSQLAPGYVDSPAQTRETFVNTRFPGCHSKRWYRTGDVVESTPEGLVFHGRRDMQVKFRGHRVELGEIEAVLQRVAKTPLAIVIAWPPSGAGPVDRLLAFIMPPHDPAADLHAMIRDQLPAHMVPARIFTINQPVDAILNDNKKLDRAKIAEIYKDCLG